MNLDKLTRFSLAADNTYSSKYLKDTLWSSNKIGKSYNPYYSSRYVAGLAQCYAATKEAYDRIKNNITTPHTYTTLTGVVKPHNITLDDNISVFFTYRDVCSVATTLGILEQVVLNELIRTPSSLSSTRIAAARMDLVRYLINDDIDIIDWYIPNQIADAVNLYEKAINRFGMSISFRPRSSKPVLKRSSSSFHDTYVVEKCSTETIRMYELLKGKLLGFNDTVISCNDLMLYEDKDMITITFKLSMNQETIKIGKVIPTTDEKIIKHARYDMNLDELVTVPLSVKWCYKGLDKIDRNDRAKLPTMLRKRYNNFKIEQENIKFKNKATSLAKAQRNGGDTK